MALGLSFESRFSIRMKLLAIVLVPLIALTWFAGTIAADRRADASAADRLEIMTELSVHTGNFLHETQKERGATAVYMSSEGALFATELAAQRNLADARRAELTQYISKHRSELPESVDVALTPALSAISGMDAKRQQAKDLAVPTGEIIGYYSDMNAKLLAAIAAVATASSSVELQAMAVAYVSFLNAKENAGIERAQLATVFVKDEWLPGKYATVVRLIALQNSFLKTFQQTANPETLAFFVEKQGDPLVDAVAEYERIAIESPDGSFGVDSGVWFDTMTGRINLLKEVENYQSDAILERAGEIRSDATGQFRSALLALMITVSLVLGISAIVITRLVRRLSATVDALEQVAEGDFTTSVEVNSNDEVGRIGEALNTAVSSVRSTLTSIDSTANSLAQSAAALQSVSTSMNRNAAEASGLAVDVSSSAQQTSSSVQMVDDATSQMSESFTEISSHASEAARIAAQAVESATVATDGVTRMQQTGDRIGSVIGLITGIAAQIDMLALNATIESARAGEAGRGFAIVADEVKRLARETTVAADEISASVQAIQDEMGSAVGSISEISAVIGSINESQTAIAAAVEQQTALNSDISHSVTEAAGGVTTIADNVTGVAQAAEATSQGADETEHAADQLADLATHLTQLVGEFRISDAGPQKNTAPSTEQDPEAPAGHQSEQHRERHTAGV